MSSKQGPVARAVNRFMDLDGPSYGDERERAVFTEAATFGMAAGILASLAIAVVAAVLGSLIVPTVVLALMAVPAWATIGYAQRRGVSADELADRASPGRRVGIAAAVFGGIALALAAMAYTIFTGDGIIALPAVELTGPEASGAAASMVRGAVIGGAGGAAVGLVAVLVGPKLRARRAGNPAEDELDED